MDATDGDGMYMIPDDFGLAPGDVKVTVTNIPDGFVNTYDRDGNRDGMATAPVAPGQFEDEFDFGYVKPAIDIEKYIKVIEQPGGINACIDPATGDKDKPVRLTFEYTNASLPGN